MRQKLIVWVIFQIMLFNAFESKAQIVINEILASNTSCNLNVQSQNFVDWIELYNHSNTGAFIGDWYLSDEKEMPTKWKIPSDAFLGPKGLKLFWFGNKGTANYKNFKLSAEGESIYLFNKALVLVDSIAYPAQWPDVSYGRSSGALQDLVYFQEATPMKANPASGHKIVHFSDEPLFSEKAGFYEESFKLKLTVASNLEKIYYTLDGSKPNATSKIYSKPIEIKNSCVVRAIAYSPNKLPSKIIGQTFLIKEAFTLPVISLTIDPKYLWDEKMGMYVEGEKYIKDKWETANYFQDWERPVHVEYFDAEGKTGFKMKAGLKIHGRSTRNNAQKTLAIFAKKKYGSDTIPYPLFGADSPKAMNSFLLRSGGNDWGVTCFVDGLIHTLVNGKIDIDAQLYQPAIVYLNGEYWGIHNIREKINADYIKNRYPNDTSEIDIIEANGHFAGKLEATHGLMDEYHRLMAFIANNELSIFENYNEVKKWIDVDEFINYVAIQAYILNEDWPNSNHKFWKFRSASGKWRWALYDTELSFKEKHGASFNIFENMFNEDSEPYLTFSWSNHLIRKLFESEALRFEFIQRLAVYLNTIFEQERVLNVFDRIKGNLEPEMARNLRKWGGIQQKVMPYIETAKTLDEWNENIEFFRSFAKNRPPELRKSMMAYFDLDEPVKLKLRLEDELGGRISLMGYILENGNLDADVFPNIPIRLEAIPNEGYRFVKWKGGECERNCVITIKKSMKMTAIFKKIE